jgi:hypothetical protein
VKVAPGRSVTALRLITSPTLLVIAIAVLSLSVHWLIPSAESADLRDLAASLKNGFQLDADYLAHFVGESGGDYPTADCRDAVTRANLTVTPARRRSLRRLIASASSFSPGDRHVR